MATGAQSTESRRTVTVRLVEGATAANGAPSGAPMSTPTAGKGYDPIDLNYRSHMPDNCAVRIKSTAGSATMTVSYARAWGYSLSGANWTPLGTGADATKGYLNGGTALGEVSADSIVHEEVLYFPHLIDGIYIELGVFGGTSTAVNVEVDFPRGPRGA